MREGLIRLISIKKIVELECLLVKIRSNLAISIEELHDIRLLISRAGDGKYRSIVVPVTVYRSHVRFYQHHIWNIKFGMIEK